MDDKGVEELKELIKDLSKKVDRNTKVNDEQYDMISEQWKTLGMILKNPERKKVRLNGKTMTTIVFSLFLQLINLFVKIFIF